MGKHRRAMPSRPFRSPLVWYSRPSRWRPLNETGQHAEIGCIINARTQRAEGQTIDARAVLSAKSTRDHRHVGSCQYSVVGFLCLDALGLRDRLVSQSWGPRTPLLLPRRPPRAASALERPPLILPNTEHNVMRLNSQGIRSRRRLAIYSTDARPSFGKAVTFSFSSTARIAFADALAALGIDLPPSRICYPSPTGKHSIGSSHRNMRTAYSKASVPPGGSP